MEAATLKLFSRRGAGTPTSIPPSGGGVKVSDPELAASIRFQGLTDGDLETVKYWMGRSKGWLERVVERFYAHVTGNGTTRGILTTHSSVERQRPMLTRYLETLASGVIDDTYVSYRKRVGAAHDRIDLHTKWFMAIYEQIRIVMSECVVDAG